MKSLVSLFSTDDYPIEAMRLGDEGTAQVRLTITTDGRVGQCEVISSSGSQILDRATCDILQRRARFKPALDNQGHPTVDYYTQKVRWELPRQAVEDQYARAALALDPASAGPARILEERVNLDVTCDSFKMHEKGILAMLPTPRHSGALVVEMGQRVGKGEFLLKAGLGPGVQRLTLNAVTMTLGADGLVNDCTAAYPGSDATQVQAECDRFRGRKFESLHSKDGEGLTRYVTVYLLSYLRD